MTRGSVAVLGAGSWGTALALVLSRNGHSVRLWGRDREQIQAMAVARENLRYLAGESFPDHLEPTPDLAAAVAGARDVVLVVPSHAFRAVVAEFARLEARPRGLVWATKGFDPVSGSLLHTVAAELLPSDLPRAVLSGPTFAREIAARLPAAVTVAAENVAYAQQVASLFANPRLRVYPSPDVVGVQVGGALKNVLAIAAGIADGLGFGANARAALIARGLHEMSRLGQHLGAQRETMMGLAGLGDLVLTCTDDQSRNRRFGLALGRGEPVEAALAEIGQVVEGIQAAKTVVVLAQRLQVELPIAQQVKLVLDGAISAVDAVENLFSRDIPLESQL